MRKKYHSLFSLGLGVIGAGTALLLNGCGGSSFEKTTYGTYQNALPAAYGIEATAANGNISGPLGGPFFYETSGLSSADGSKAYLTAATDFAALKNPNGATLLSGVDPAATGKVPLGFSGTAGTQGSAGDYIDANTAISPAVPSAVAPGASVVFRAAISNGISSSTRSAIPITYNGVSLSSSDPQWTLGSLPLTFNYNKTGPFANATYVTGTPVSSGQGTLTPFAVPFTTTGLHTVVLTVSDDAGQQTATTFAIPVVAASDVALLLQNIDTGTQDAKKNEVFNPISAGDTVTVDGGPGTGVYPAGYKPTTADAQGTVILFVPAGAHSIVYTSADKKTTFTQALAADALKAGTTFIQ